ncbi:MAG: hypothetical protein M3Y58_19480 [Chloroflexota bacterium]|nr:hypothetical protein [Chloroflexota bacterium]
MTNADELYQEYIKPLSPAEKRRLLTLISRGLAGDDDNGEEHSILELEGLGAEIWKDVDAQEYVNALRDEWDHRP